MFTGIIEHVARVERFEKKGDSGARLVLEKPATWNIKLGDSIAVAGACLTVVEQDSATYSFDLMPETLEKTTFGLVNPEKVNLEQAASLGAKLDGHMVSGHIDSVGKIEQVRANDGAYDIRVTFSEEFAPLVVMKGSITIDGVSLTVSDVGDSWCEVSLVPYTLEHTTLGALQKGDSVNLEFDMIGKYINRFMKTQYAGK